MLINRTIKYKNESHSFRIMKKKGICKAELDGILCEEVRIVNKFVGSVEIPVTLSGDLLLIVVPHERAKIIYLIRDGIEVESGCSYRPVRNVIWQSLLLWAVSFLPALILFLPMLPITEYAYLQILCAVVIALLAALNVQLCLYELCHPIISFKKKLGNALASLICYYILCVLIILCQLSICS